jgi:hypothetical protein
MRPLTLQGQHSWQGSVPDFVVSSGYEEPEPEVPVLQQTHLQPGLMQVFSTKVTQGQVRGGWGRAFQLHGGPALGMEP